MVLQEKEGSVKGVKRWMNELVANQQIVRNQTFVPPRENMAFR
jgi:hypothetical protein